MSDSFEEKIKKEFIIEASEMLDAVESAFIDLERTPDDSLIIDKIFRMAHTIKGSAFSCGFMQLGEFAHIVEMLLVRVREKKLVMDANIIDILLRSNDRLRDLVLALQSQTGKSVDTTDLATMIQTILNIEAPNSGVTNTSKTEFGDWGGFFDEEPNPAPTKPSTTTDNSVDLNAIRALTGELIESGFDSYLKLVQTLELEKVNANGEFTSVIESMEALLVKMMQLRGGLAIEAMTTDLPVLASSQKAS